jgi:peptide/nickel transport system substrate-binding protein
MRDDVVHQVRRSLRHAAATQDSSLQMPRFDVIGRMYAARFNHLHKPFNDPQIRHAAMAAFAQEPFLRAQVGVRQLYRTCYSMLVCNTPYGTTAGSEIQAKGSLKKAQELLKASAYDGTPVVIMKPTDLLSVHKLPDVAAQLLSQAGFKVEVQAMDWQSLVGRLAKRDPPDKGGWNLFITNGNLYWNLRRQ